MVKGDSKRIVVVTGIGDFKPSEIKAVLKRRDAVAEGLRASGYDVKYFEIYQDEFFQDKRGAISEIKKLSPDCVFNLFEGFCGDSKTEVDLVRLMEEEKMPFTGNGSSALETCLNKFTTKKLLRENGIKVPSGIQVKDPADIEKNGIDFPVFIKPIFEDASLGIDKKSLAADKEELKGAIEDKLRQFPRGLIVEEFIPGREYNAGFIGGHPYELVGLSVLDYGQYPECDNFLSFKAKWEARTKEYKKLIPDILDEKDARYKNEVVEISRRASKILGCSCYFRVDCREKGEELYILDVNPNPDISPDSGFVRQANLKGLTYDQIVAKIAHYGLKAR
ncbi:MAG: ATP-grasp domain-containing protein [Candidatus Omnitrophica bacterium]|nr:ATP-grasp domain-containing protein [Candidatus Omnitrophota bacterium]